MFKSRFRYPSLLENWVPSPCIVGVGAGWHSLERSAIITTVTSTTLYYLKSYCGTTLHVYTVCIQVIQSECTGDLN